MPLPSPIRRPATASKMLEAPQRSSFLWNGARMCKKHKTQNTIGFQVFLFYPPGNTKIHKEKIRKDLYSQSFAAIIHRGTTNAPMDTCCDLSAVDNVKVVLSCQATGFLTGLAAYKLSLNRKRIWKSEMNLLVFRCFQCRISSRLNKSMEPAKSSRPRYMSSVLSTTLHTSKGKLKCRDQTSKTRRDETNFLNACFVSQSCLTYVHACITRNWTLYPIFIRLVLIHYKS